MHNTAAAILLFVSILVVVPFSFLQFTNSIPGRSDRNIIIFSSVK